MKKKIRPFLCYGEVGSFVRSFALLLILLSTHLELQALVRLLERPESLLKLSSAYISDWKMANVSTCPLFLLGGELMMGAGWDWVDLCWSRTKWAKLLAILSTQRFSISERFNRRRNKLYSQAFFFNFATSWANSCTEPCLATVTYPRPCRNCNRAAPYRDTATVSNPYRSV